MIKLYITISIIATILNLLCDIKCLTNKNIRLYIKSHKPNKTIRQRLISDIKDIIACWIPIMNLLMICLEIYIILASDLQVIKLLNKLYLTNKENEKELNKYMSDI